MSKTMKEVIVHPLPTLTAEIHEVEIPTPKPDEVLIKVIIAGSNVKGKAITYFPTSYSHSTKSPQYPAKPKAQNFRRDFHKLALTNFTDWAHLTARKISINSGDDIAGVIHALGTEAAVAGEFNIGDRVAAFQPMLTPGGAYAEYAVAPWSTVFKLPIDISFEGEISRIRKERSCDIPDE
jgi:NADPH:quinone reductase